MHNLTRDLSPAWRLASTLAIGVLVGASTMASTGAFADIGSEVREQAARGDWAGALQRVERAVAADPRNASLRFLQGVVLMDAKKDDQALALFMQMAQEHPDLPDPHNNLALLHARAGRLEPALAAVQDALRAEPTHRVARANLAQLHLMLAVQTWEGLARSGPVDASLLTRLETARGLLRGAAPAGR